MNYKFCPVCAHPLKEKKIDGRIRKVCEKCGFIHYKNPAPAAGVILEKDGKILLVKRKYKPKAGLWSLPAGFVEYDESPDAAAVRETFEETGIKVSIVKLFEVFGACDLPDNHVVVVLYIAEMTGGKLRPGDDAEAAEFFPLQGLPADMAFSSHKKALQKYIDGSARQQINGNII